MEKIAKFQAGEILLAGCRTKSDRLLVISFRNSENLIRNSYKESKLLWQY